MTVELKGELAIRAYRAALQLEDKLVVCNDIPFARENGQVDTVSGWRLVSAPVYVLKASLNRETPWVSVSSDGRAAGMHATRELAIVRCLTVVAVCVVNSRMATADGFRDAVSLLAADGDHWSDIEDHIVLHRTNARYEAHRKAGEVTSQRLRELLVQVPTMLATRWTQKGLHTMPGALAKVSPDGRAFYAQAGETEFAYSQQVILAQPAVCGDKQKPIQAPPDAYRLADMSDALEGAVLLKAGLEGYEMRSFSVQAGRLLWLAQVAKTADAATLRFRHADAQNGVDPFSVRIDFAVPQIVQSKRRVEAAYEWHHRTEERGWGQVAQVQVVQLLAALSVFEHDELVFVSVRHDWLVLRNHEGTRAFIQTQQ